MKRFFPYFVAAEFTMFQSSREFTLPHLLAGLSFVIVSLVLFRTDFKPWRMML